MNDEAVRAVEMKRFAEARAEAGSDHVARQEPLEIQIGGASLAVVTRTPGHDLELVRGFLLTERVVEEPGDVEAIRHCSELPDPAAEDNVVRVTLRDGVEIDLDRLRRNRGPHPRGPRSRLRSPAASRLGRRARPRAGHPRTWLRDRRRAARSASKHLKRPR